ncbi:MAG: hypothetical protein FWE12_02770 [Oscillospiraceae bacterium]|nr:hypothetical protein [Oscillospiraceae bacterium]
MASITNVQIFGLDESIYRSGYPMLKAAPTEEEFQMAVAEIRAAREAGEIDNTHIRRAIKLANAKGGGHEQYLSGITVTFDMTLSNKAWVEAERYRFLTFISSMSTMHRVAFFKIGESCNFYTSKEAIAAAEALQETYNGIDAVAEPDRKKAAYLELLYNLPSGFELMAGMVTNYRCLRNIYEQRRTHRLPDWHIVCDWLETLPLAKELIVGKPE